MAVLFVLLVTLPFFQLGQAFVCPPKEIVAPCSCFSDSRSTIMTCNGVNVTQESLTSLFSNTRAINGLSSTDWLNLTNFRILDTLLTQIDLTPLFYSRCDLIQFEKNRALTQIYATKLNQHGKLPGLIDAVNVTMTQNRLSDQGLENFLAHFSPSMLNLNLAQNILTGSQTQADFIPNLSSLVQLQGLNLGTNHIEKLSGGQFKNNKNLLDLDLSFNQITQLGPQALLIDENPDLVNITLYISLHASPLKNEGIVPNNGLELSKRKTSLTLRFTQFEYLSAANFEPFLNNHGDNRMVFDLYSFVCDQRMKWLKDGRVEFEKRVGGVNCGNDMGKTVFTTNLIN